MLSGRLHAMPLCLSPPKLPEVPVSCGKTQFLFQIPDLPVLGAIKSYLFLLNNLCAMLYSLMI